MKPLCQPLPTGSLRCWVIGHRGAAARCLENTISSFCLARDAGAFMIELDVQQSTDGELFVFHDHTLERLCGEALPVHVFSWEELSARVLGHWQGQTLRIPRLAEVFATLQRSLCYNVELKIDTVAYAGIEARLTSLVRACGLAERVLVSSFHHDSLRLMRQEDSHIPLGLLLSLEQAHHLGSPAAVVARARELQCFSVHPDFHLLSQWPELVAACHAANLRVFPWTVDSPADWQVLVHVQQVDGIITNDPGRLYEWLLTQPSLKTD